MRVIAAAGLARQDHSAPPVRNTTCLHYFKCIFLAWLVALCARTRHRKIRHLFALLIDTALLVRPWLGWFCAGTGDWPAKLTFASNTTGCFKGQLIWMITRLFTLYLATFESGNWQFYYWQIQGIRPICLSGHIPAHLGTGMAVCGLRGPSR